MVEEFKQNDYSKIGSPVKAYGFGYRHVQTLLVFAIMAMCYVVRSGMSVAIIAMTDTNNNDTNSEIYDWDKKTQDFVLSSFFWGYMLNQIPAGQLAHKFGGKILLIVAMGANGILLITMPSLISLGGWKAACGSRMFQGLTQSAMMPSIHTIVSKWAPVSERGRHANFILAGGPFGTVIGMPLAGLLSRQLGWDKAFHILGSMALVIGSIWFMLGYNRPSDHPKISQEEKCFIETSLGQKSGHRVLSTPWKSIFTSRPVWILILTHIGFNWALLVMMLETPSFFSMALGIDMQKSGFLSALPYIAMWGFGLLSSIVADHIINKKYCRIITTRKLASTVSAWGLGIGLIVLSFIPREQVVLSVVILIFSIGTTSAMNVGFLLNHIDLSPNFAGVLMGITNCAANAVGVLAPISAGYILKDPTDQSQWRSVFFLTSGISFGCNLIFQIFGTSDKQPWNDPDEDVENSEMIQTKQDLKSAKEMPRAEKEYISNVK